MRLKPFILFNLFNFRNKNLFDLLGIIKTDYVHVNGCSGVSVCNNVNSNDNSLNGLFQITFPNSVNIIAAHSAKTYLSTLQKLRTI